jgi:hypothetical protein
MYFLVLFFFKADNFKKLRHHGPNRTRPHYPSAREALSIADEQFTPSPPQLLQQPRWAGTQPSKSQRQGVSGREGLHEKLQLH